MKRNIYETKIRESIGQNMPKPESVLDWNVKICKAIHTTYSQEKSQEEVSSLEALCETYVPEGRRLLEMTNLKEEMIYWPLRK